jgi:O-antigen/teichoic acid export membrane protein
MKPRDGACPYLRLAYCLGRRPQLQQRLNRSSDRSDMKPLLDGAIYLVANIASAAVPLLLLPLLTRVLPPDDYGRVVAFALLVALCQSAAGLNTHAALAILWFRRPADEMPRLVGMALALTLGSTIAVALVAELGLLWLPVAGLEPGWGAIASVTAGANVILQMRLVLWQSATRAVPVAVAQFTASSLNIALSLIAVLAFSWGGEGRNLGIFASAILMALFAASALWRSNLIAFLPNLAELRYLITFGVPLIPHIVGGVLLSTADRWAVSVMLDSATLGIYGAGAQLGAAMTIVGDAFVKAYSPWMYARLGSEEPRDRLVAVGAIYASMPAFFVMAAVVGLGLAIVSNLLLGPDYRSAIEVLPWFLLGGAFNGIYLSVAVLFFHSARTGRLAMITLGSGAVGSIASFFLVDSFGIVGGAAGFAFSYAVLAVAVTAQASRIFDLPWQQPRAALANWLGVVIGNRRRT